MGMQDGAGKSAEQQLEEIARSDQWEMPRAVTQYRDALDETVRGLQKIVDRLEEPTVYECRARGQASQYCRDIVGKIKESNLNHQIGMIQDRIDDYNEAIRAAQSVSLPGDALDESSQRAIMKTTEPMNWVVPGLGTLTGIAGIAGVNAINRLLATNRDEVAAEKLKKIKDRIKKDPFPENIIPVVDPPAPDDDDNYISGGGSGSGTGDGTLSSLGNLPASVTSAAALAGAGGAGAYALSRAGASAGSGSGDSSILSSSGQSGSSHGSGSSSQGGSSSPQYQRVPAGSGGNGSGSGNAGNGTINSGNHGSSTNGGRDEYGDYYYDPVKKQWIHKDNDYVSVDSGSGGLNGSSTFGKVAGTAGVAGLGAGVGAGGAFAAGKLAGGAAGGAGLTAVGGAGGLAAVSGAGGVGSYYANTPVHAVPASSSIKGATGMAAGLSSSSAASSAASGAGARTGAPGMMGGQGGAGNGKKQKRRGLGYIAPTLEDDEQFEAKPLAAMAGRRKRPNE